VAYEASVSGADQIVALHHKLGFTDVGVLDEVGYKDGSFVSTLLLELKL